MKFLTPLLCLLFAQGIAIAEEPAELSERRQAWETQRTEAQEKIDKIYFDELEQLKKNYTKARNIAAALAVDNVIKGGEKAPDKPWEGAEGLEWTIPSPAPYHSFTTPPEVK